MTAIVILSWGLALELCYYQGDNIRWCTGIGSIRPETFGVRRCCGRGISGHCRGEVRICRISPLAALQLRGVVAPPRSGDP
jgi:hypothetical protein